MKPFHEIHSNDLNSGQLQRELDSRGYVLIRKLLPAEDVETLLREIVQNLSANDWFLPNHSPMERVADPNAACGEPDPLFKLIYEQIFNLEALHRFAHHPRLREVMHSIVGSQLLVHPKPIARLIFPNWDRFVVHAHQDHLAIGGDPECFTAWIPLHDCPAELGPLQILDGSHRFGLQEADPSTGEISKDTARGGDWVGGQINAGDVLIFHGLTVHSASPNTSEQLRVSVDCRFQDYTRTFNPANAVFPGSNGKSWETTYANWRSEELKYFWRQIPLTFKPSREELVELIETDDSQRMRTRYARVLSQI
ncbi:phytanoyl-CoA dioxygenase family protein [Granulicella tundricola]|nr:phytanoyl-CoA dioxygenase family protein [Granulicella tundricola]